MPELGPGESLTSGGFVRRADGVILISHEGHVLVQALQALLNERGDADIIGLTMPELVARLGNSDPIPAEPHAQGYVHSWSQPGVTFSIVFGPDNKSLGTVSGSYVLGGPATPGLRARPAVAPTIPRRSRLIAVLERSMKVIKFGCGGLAALIILGVIAAAVFGHKSKPKATGVPKAESEARAYIAAHGSDGYRVRAIVANVEDAIGPAIASASAANFVALATAAQQGHDDLDAIRENFTYSDGGALGDAEGNVLLGANDLKNALGALVSVAGTPNPATVAHFNAQFGQGQSEWNSGVRAIWRIAHRAHPPVVG